MAKQRLGISIDPNIFAFLEEAAKKAGLSKSAYITTLILKEKEER